MLRDSAANKGICSKEINKNSRLPITTVVLVSCCIIRMIDPIPCPG